MAVISEADSKKPKLEEPFSVTIRGEEKDIAVLKTQYQESRYPKIVEEFECQIQIEVPTRSDLDRLEIPSTCQFSINKGDHWEVHRNSTPNLEHKSKTPRFVAYEGPSKSFAELRIKSNKQSHGMMARFIFMSLVMTENINPALEATQKWEMVILS